MTNNPSILIQNVEEKAPASRMNAPQNNRRSDGSKKRQNKKKSGNTSNGSKNPQQSRGKGLQRDPGNRGNNNLSLTRSQFTATSPLNLFQVRGGSTPGGIRVSGRELISAVTVPIANGTFLASTTFPGATGGFSPIWPNVFPRLAAYTPIYEYFVFHKLVLLFQSNQPTTQTGEIILSVDYDPTDTAPATTAAMMRMISSTMANVYSDCSLEVLKSLSRLPRYECAAAATETMQQIQASLTVAVEGYTNAAISTVGYIIAQYDVEFFSPQ